MKKAIDLNGTNEYCSKANPVGLDLNETTDRITASTDRDFETSVGNWVGAGNHTIVQSADYKKAGTYSGKITATGAGDATTNYVELPSSAFTTLVEGEKYTFEFWAYGNTSGVTLGIAIGDKVVTGKAIYNATPGTFSKIVFNFQATISTVDQPIRFYLSGAGLCYIDVVSLTQAWDGMWMMMVKPSSLTANNALFYKRTGTSYYSAFSASSTGRISTAWSSSGTEVTVIMVSGGLTTSKFNFLAITAQRDENVTIYIDGVNKISGSISSVGNMNNSAAFELGRGLSGAVWFNGLEGEFQFVRFTSLPSDIATFIADCDVNEIPPKEVVEEQYAANGASVKAHYQFKGDTDAKMLADVSGTGNNLTGVNVTQADDQVLGDYPARMPFEAQNCSPANENESQLGIIMPPIVKRIRDVMIADLATMTQTGGYNFNVAAAQVKKVARSPQKIDVFPELALEIGQGDIDPDNSGNTSFESNFDVHLYGFVNGTSDDDVADNAELMVHDLTKKVAAWHTSHLNDASYKWIVNPEKQPVTFERIVISGTLKGWVYCTFRVEVLTQPDSFSV